MSGYRSGSGEVRETSNTVLERLGCILCVREFLRWGQKQEKTWVNLKRRYACVSLISLSAQGGGGGGVRVMSIQKKGGHACTDPIRQTSMHTNWSSFIGLWLYALVISHTQIMSRDWTENR